VFREIHGHNIRSDRTAINTHHGIYIETVEKYIYTAFLVRVSREIQTTYSYLQYLEET